MKIYILYTLSCLLYVTSHAQNIVPNPSFEDTVSCPTGPNQINKCVSWQNPTGGSPDYFNTCSTYTTSVRVPNNGFGNQSANTGNAYAGFYTYNLSGREYIQAQLTSTLIANHTYSVSFYVSLADYPEYSTNTIGAYFSVTHVSSSTAQRLTFTPQVQNKSTNPLTDKNNWILITDSFVSNGNEQYIVIGNFMPDSSSDTLNVGPFSGSASSYYYIDDVSVIDLGLSSGIEHLKNKHAEINIYPNPSNGKFVLTGFDASQKNASIEVTDVTGKQVFKQQNIILNSSVELNLSLDNGVYFVNIINASGIKEVHKIVVTN